MANLTITNVDLGTVVFESPEFRDEILTLAAAQTLAEGTILGRREDALSVVASAVTGGGNGTVGTASVVEGLSVPLVGVHTLTCIAAVANGGRWKLTDPNGALVADDLEMNSSAGVGSVFEVGGLQFTITDGATDFSVGATATLTVSADGKLVPFNPSGAGGAQRPLAVLTYSVGRSSPGDVAIRAMISGKVNRNRLIIDADGSGLNITNAILDQLRRAGIVAVDVRDLSVLDNQ